MQDKSVRDVKENGELDKKTTYQRKIDQANAQKNRLMERLHFDKQQNTIHEIVVLLTRYSHEVGFRLIRNLLNEEIKSEAAKTAKEFAKLKTEV